MFGIRKKYLIELQPHFEKIQESFDCADKDIESTLNIRHKEKVTKGKVSERTDRESRSSIQIAKEILAAKLNRIAKEIEKRN